MQQTSCINCLENLNNNNNEYLDSGIKMPAHLTGDKDDTKIGPALQSDSREDEGSWNVIDKTLAQSQPGDMA